MEIKAKCCKYCGSESISIINRKLSDGDVFYTYKCAACGDTFSTVKKEIPQPKPEPAPVMDAAEVYRRNRDSVVEIVADKGENSIGSGTGMILSNGYILTNAHVVLCRDEGSPDIYQSEMIQGTLSDKTRLDFTIVKLDIKRDMALLSSKKIGKFCVTFSKREITIGEKVFAIGNSKGQGICILDGIVSDKDRIISGEKYIMYSAPTVGGNSGGPLFNNAGEVIGMVTLGQKDGTLMNYAIPVDVIKDFLNK